MRDKRIHERVPVDLPVLYQGNTWSYLNGRALDISKGGMFIQTDKAQKEGSYILADLDVEALGKIIWAQGWVVRTTRQGMAIAFTRLDAKGIDTIILMNRSLRA